MVQMQLLEKYTHQGFELPIGAVLAAPKDVAENLFATGVSELYSPEQVTDDGDPDAEIAAAALIATDSSSEPTDEVAQD